MSAGDISDSLREAEKIAEFLKQEGLECIGETCRKYRIRGWNKVMAELRSPNQPPPA